MEIFDIGNSVSCDNKYKIVDVVGEGGFSYVFKVKNENN